MANIPLDDIAEKFMGKWKAELVTVGRRATVKETRHRIQATLNALYARTDMTKPEMDDPDYTFTIHEFHSIRPNTKEDTTKASKKQSSIQNNDMQRSSSSYVGKKPNMKGKTYLD